MVTVKVDKKNETVTYSTLVEVDGKLLSFRVTKLLYYAKPYHLDHSLPLPDDLKKQRVTLFEELFYYPKEYYTNPKLNHLAYNRLVDSGLYCKHLFTEEQEKEYEKVKRPYYYQSKKLYELNWEEIHVSFDKDNRKVLILSNDKNWHPIAIPPNGSDEKRFDCITDDGMYHYNCKEKEFQGILITLEPKDGKISFCFSVS